MTPPRRPGPTTRQSVEGPLLADPTVLIREECEKGGCLCGDALEILPRSMEQGELEDFLVGSNAEVATSWEVRHHPSCPMLARSAGLN